MNPLETAKRILAESEYTCVICSDTDIQTSTGRGVAPLLQWLDEGKDLRDYAAADKVVGNGAAFLYVLLHIRELHAGVISRAALKTLEDNAIPVTYTTLTEAIRNRDHTGLCPIETAVGATTDPLEALAAIRSKLADMQK